MTGTEVISWGTLMTLLLIVALVSAGSYGLLRAWHAYARTHWRRQLYRDLHGPSRPNRRAGYCDDSR